ncbi:hypothetical protein M2463_000947 [Parabacteroides sp. PH5-13]|nr:hypothetical protein [Parabacteroides sp. PH5-39]MDH6315287.1 hypothetical protein [Parabacteroides sp. PF5-13]MDH6318947.1 hypothetical protein [Parabacteroides sp. PH5-13]MDH6322676.1 hypothetical protein [Parabacteroides sp. PH5-8]MDH6345343.1 hypothetical protein [Parabacteroides sp. PH5-46]MDH6375966.1 hypothetical protein [Parabacteroides sp. PH5-33]MDH6393167.1 hypothetical protein [Parabacteroides sp. PFB2-22]MDH6405963.1 hypothetical protein [Parabacteroides sp. PH5-26]
MNEGGVFIFDVFTEELVKDKQEEKDWDYASQGGFWSQNEYLLLNQTFHYPKNKALGNFQNEGNLVNKRSF